MDISKVPELVDASGYDVMIEAYQKEDPMYPSLIGVEPLSDDKLYGDKATSMTGMGRFQERQDGAPVEADEMRTADTWYLKTRQYSRKVVLPERMVRASDAQAKISGLISKLASSFGGNAPLQKDDYIADMFQKGTLTAGDADFFDGTFPNQTDPYPKYIFDGLPWFDGAHTQIVGGNTFSNLTVSAALTVASLQTALILHEQTNARDNRNERIRNKANVLVVPTGLEYTARAILESKNLPGGGNNDINPMAGRLELHVWDALDDGASSSSWWIGAKGEGIHAIDSGIPTLDTAWNPQTKSWEVIVEYHFGAAVTDWRKWTAQNKAAS